MIKQELYKLCIKRKFLLVMVFVFSVEFLLFFYSSQNIKFEDKASQIKYQHYMDLFSGAITPEKRSEIEKLIENDEQIILEMAEKEKKYIEREINDEQYVELLNKYSDYKEGYNGYVAFIETYNYAVENGNELIDSKPWDLLFNNESIDFLLVILITMSAIFLYISDLENGVELITVTTENGKMRKDFTQVVICIFIAAFSTIVVDIGKYIIIDLVYGLKNPDLKLSNIEIFSESSYDLSLIQAYLITCFIKLFGSIYLVVLTCFTGIYLKNSLLTGFTSIITVLMPNYILSEREYKYLIPLPSAFLTANGYLFGDMIYTEIMFKKITPLKLLLVFGISVTIIITASIKVIRRNKL